jgi:hypothetical protein
MLNTANIRPKIAAWKEDWTWPTVNRPLIVLSPGHFPIVAMGGVPITWRRSRRAERSVVARCPKREVSQHVVRAANQDSSPGWHHQQGTRVCSDYGNSWSLNAEISFISHKYCIPFHEVFNNRQMAVTVIKDMHGAVTIGLLSAWLLLSD